MFELGEKSTRPVHKRTRGQPEIFKDRVVKVKPLDAMEVQEWEHWPQTRRANVELFERWHWPKGTLGAGRHFLSGNPLWLSMGQCS